MALGSLHILPAWFFYSTFPVRFDGLMQLGTSLAAACCWHYSTMLLFPGQNYYLWIFIWANCLLMHRRCLFLCGLLAGNFAGLNWYRSASFLATAVILYIYIDYENTSVILGGFCLGKLKSGINLCWKTILTWQILDILAEKSNEEWLYGHEVSKRKGKNFSEFGKAAKFGCFRGWGRGYFVLTL